MGEPSPVHAPAHRLMPISNLVIVGVGLIGGSIGLAARRRGVAVRVVGVGRQASSLERARDVGAIDEGSLDLQDAVRSADVVVFCTPVDRIPAQVVAASEVCRPDTLLTDAGSTKARMIAEVESASPHAPFVGSHPLAGSDKSGPEYADAELFEGRLTLVTPTPRTRPELLERTLSFWQALGSRVHIISADEHDRCWP